MIGRLNHVAIAVGDLAAAAGIYRDLLGAKVSAPQTLTEHGVRVVFVELDNTKIELITPLSDDSPIASFVEKRGNGIHHLCYEVSSIKESAKKLNQQGCRILGDDKIQIGAHGKPVLFLHPAETGGILIELEEA